MKRDQVKNFVNLNREKLNRITPMFASHYLESTPGIYTIQMFEIFENSCIGVVSDAKTVTATFGMLAAMCEKNFDELLLGNTKAQLLHPLAFTFGRFGGETIIIIEYMTENDNPKDVSAYYASIKEQKEGQKDLVLL